MAVVDAGAADVAFTESVYSPGDAIYFRVVDGANWLRARVDKLTTYTTSPTGTYHWDYNYSCTWTSSSHSGTGYYNDYDQGSSSSFDVSHAMGIIPWSSLGCASPPSYAGGARYIEPTTSSTSSTSYALSLDKSVSGTVTSLATKSVGSSMPAYFKVIAKGTSIVTSYGSTSATTSAGSTVTDSTNLSATRHGVGYATGSTSSPSGIKGITIVDAP